MASTHRPQPDRLSRLAQHPALHAVFLFLVVFVPLLVPSTAMHTDEEEHWRHRTTYFVNAMSMGHFADTVQTEHPGITVMALAGAAQLTWQRFGGQPLALVDYLQVLRFPIKLVNALAVALGYLALRRAFGGRLAFWGALLWATSPYLRWYLRIVHIDGLTTSFMTLSFVLMLLGFGLHREREDGGVIPIGWVWVVLAAFVGGLAALTRFSSFYLFGMAGVLTLINWYHYRRMVMVRTFFMRIAAPVALFAVVIALTWTTLYPAMWTNAAEVYAQTVHGVDNALSPHGSFFMGEHTPSPNALFYPVTLLFRLTPWVSAGVLLGTAAVFSGAVREQYRLWLAVLLYTAIYLAIITAQAKKMDRYALVFYPMLGWLAALGWLWLADKLWRRWVHTPRSTALIAVLVVGLAAYPLAYLRDEYAYINPLLGPDLAERMMLIGGGEGLQGLRTFYDLFTDEERCGKIIASSYAHVAGHYVPCARIWSVWHLNPVVVENADYIVNYINFRQRDPRAQERLAGLTPIFTADYGGITYVEIYDGDTVREANAAWLDAWRAEEAAKTQQQQDEAETASTPPPTDDN